MYQTLLSSFYVDVHGVKSSYFHNKITKTFSPLPNDEVSKLLLYHLPSRPHPLTPSTSHLSSTHTHHQLIPTNWQFPYSIQSG